MSKSKHNFNDPKAQAKVEYHLWVLYQPNAKWADKNTGRMVNLPLKKTYNGFFTKPDKGLQGLRDLVHERASIIQKAQLYRTHVDQKLAEWDASNKCWK